MSASKPVKDTPSAADDEVLGEALQKTFGKNFRACRIKAGLSQVQVAERSGIAQNKISSIEHGTFNLTLRSVERLARVVEADASILLKSKL